MSTDIAAAREKVFAAIDEDELVQLVLQLGNIYSPYGRETEAGNAVHEWMKLEGFAPRKVGITPERFNVIGTLAGRGSGRNLLFSSHLDTTGPRGDVFDPMIYNEKLGENPYWHEAWVDGDTINGFGVENDKGPMACFMIAAKAVRKAGVELDGDVYLTACPGEMGQEPVDETSGLEYLSKEVGAEYMMTHGGIMADFGIAAEGTDFAMSWVEPGKAFFKVTVKGRGGYTPMYEYKAHLAENNNPILKASVLIQALAEWAQDYETRYTSETDAGTIVPKIGIGAIRGGHPHYIIGPTSRCSLYLDCRILPGMKPRVVRDEIAAVCAECALDCEVELFVFRPGYGAEREAIEPFYQAMSRAHGSVRPEPLVHGDPVFSSMWRDHQVFNKFGVPSVTYGPSRYKPTIRDMMDCTRVYAAAMLETCLNPAS